LEQIVLSRFSRVGASALGIDTVSNGALLGLRRIVDCDVCDEKGNVVGKLEELVIDARTGCVRHAVVGIGGLLGIGRQRFGISWSALTPDLEKRRWKVDMTLLRLTAWPIQKAKDGGQTRRFESESRAG
jgi:sporulation protein YlmC with PRC-barrel domain